MSKARDVIIVCDDPIIYDGTINDDDEGIIIIVPSIYLVSLERRRETT